MAAQPQLEIRNKHQQRTLVTRRKLLAAARGVFARDGFEASSIEDIAAEAGHTRGAFYANFETKEDLFFALLEEQASERISQLQRELAKHETVTARYRTLRDFYLERATDRKSVMLTLEFKLFALRHPNMRARLAAAHQRIRASLNYEAVAKMLPARRNPSDRELDKVLLEIVLSGLVLEHAYDPKRVSAKQMLEALRRMFDVVVGSA